ncbi:hypothetical protein GKZ90_0018510 [Flavobacterium sp. MC2016-06]|jgi:hypothetical protein|uniref:hypothetical protein n=1 Tax=Flavobacterium sp. MC2016-06 TaxID=2676308 RepID=UPI0012BA8154|nr:hypothetical protein [Flavobacterium sp. MC2016-06]MBU3858454.1 hypothetical protein [Flavobacterium sp. MC2016-06]
MTKYHKRHRIIATLFLLIFFPTLFPNNLFASNNGPKSPEAASFEPVDATDMVNLITGQYSYVLPLLNVPSPEGGYPLAMAYHAGIGLEQEASWTGLGWNVNPGSIDRNINGYPDDYNSSHLNEYFYDAGGQQYASFVSVGYSLGVASASIGFNWGSNQALGGYVGVGVGYSTGNATVGVNATVGTSGASVGVGVQFTGGLTVGVSAGTDGNVGVSAGFNSNGQGFNIGYNTSGSYSMGLSTGTGNNNTASLDISFSSTGIGLSGGIKNRNSAGKTVGGVGVGYSMQFNNTAKMGDYNSSKGGWMVPLMVPTPYGIFSLSFGKQTFKYWLAKNKENYTTGPLYFQKGVNNVTRQVWQPEQVDDYGRIITEGYWYDVIVGQAFMDINEIPIESNALATSTDLKVNNAAFPSYDNYNIQAQGLSGTMSAPIHENGALFGLDAKENMNDYLLRYNINGSVQPPDFAQFNGKPTFYLENEISTYINVQAASYNSTLTNIDILNSYNTGSVELAAKSRRKTSTFIEYYTNNEITNLTTYPALKQNGYLQPNVSGLDRSSLPKDGIGAYKITASDGKTYHYSLPVYNHEVITRTFGAVANNLTENKSYYEKRQLEPYATHWLLTAVTGPDYVDNGDGVAGDGDLGYWTSFEYGKWTDAFVWKAPYKKDYIIDDRNSNIKTWIRGRKQLYYLDKVKTRTHTALFIKSERNDGASENWTYSSVSHIDSGPGSYTSRFTIPSQNQLRLDKIILLKNADDVTNKTYGTDLNQNVNISYPNSEKTLQNAKYNMKDNVLDTGDNWSSCVAKAIKVIDFGYDTSLVPGDNRLTLLNVNFKGKAGANVLPPYKFGYLNDVNTFNIDKKDGWGYPIENPATYSLNKITTPQGGTININYESNNFISTVPNELLFASYNTNSFTANAILTNSNPLTTTIEVGNQNYYPITLGQTVNIYYSNTTLSSAYGDYIVSYNGTGYISNILGNGKYQVTFNGPTTSTGTNPGQGITYVSMEVKINLSNLIYIGGGPRVSNLKISDGLNNYITDYKYGQNENGLGYVSYVPYTQNITKEAPYSSQLPAPRVMYEYVTMNTHKEGMPSENKIRYKFNIMKTKDPNKVKYGDFYEIVETKTPTTITNQNKEVNISSFIVKDNLAAIGQLLEVSTFNNKGQQLSKINNSYYGMSDNTTNIGVTQESYQTYKTVDYTTNTATLLDKWIVNSSTRIKYPNIIKSSTEQTNGYSYTTEFSDYDPISGASKETKYSSSDGQSFKTRIIPAYLKYPEMGSKVDNITNKNMLSQVTANYSYILNNAVWKETGVGITTWSNVWAYKDMAGTTVSPTALNEKIWRKHKSYTWNGAKDANGIFSSYASATDDSFNWNLPSGVGIDVVQPAQWKQIGEITLYDHYSNSLEAKDINGNYASTKMGDNDTKVTTTGNAGYNEMFFSGAENTPPTSFSIYLEPEVTMINASRNSVYYHTGKQSVAATSSSQFGVAMKNGQHRAGKYKISVWVEKTNAAKARINNNGTIVDFTESYNAGNWVLKSGYISVPSGAYSVNVTSIDTSTVYFDDLMIRPIASSINGYVYNEWDELTYIIGNNGLATRFEYDASGRLVKTYSEVIDDTVNQVTGGFKLSKTTTYNNRYLN